MLCRLTRVRRRVFVLISSRGSRTQLMAMMKELDDALQCVEEVNDELKMSVSEDKELLQEADEYMASATKQYDDAYERAQGYLKSRQDEPPSVASDAEKSQTSGPGAVRKAEVALQLKQQELQILQQRQQRERKEQELKRNNELQSAKEAEELVRLEVRLTAAAEDDLNWDRRKDFDGEAAATAVQTHCTETGKSTHASQTQQPEPLFLRSLPRITLPKFSGSPGEWPKWYALFRTLVHDQPLNSTQKMVHLQSAVAGPAQQIISGLLYEGRLYEDALRALEDRFGKNEDIVLENMKAIFRSPSPSSNQDLQGLERFHSAVHSAVTVLQNLEYDGDLHSTENLRRVVEKLPQDMKYAWSEHAVEMEPRRASLTEFDQWLAKQVRITQKLASVTLTRQDRRQGGWIPGPGAAQKAPRQKPVSETRATLTTGTTSTSQTQYCVCCEGAHPLKECPAFQELDADRRAQLVLRTGTCFVCLKRGHRIKTCAFKRDCGIDGCTMKHHQLLHGSKRVTSPARDNEHRVVAAVTERERISESVTLLQVVPVRVHTEDGYRDTLALLDPGSQTSLVSDQLVRDANLTGDQQQLCIENVEGRGNTRRTTRVQLTLSPLCAGEDPHCKIFVPEAFSVPRVNVRVQEIPNKTRNWEKWRHLHGLQLPDCTRGTVEILLGANVLEAVLQREARIGRAGEPVAVRTAFGWSLTGTIAGFTPASTNHRQVMFLLRQQVEEWWTTEAFGTRCDVNESSAEDQRSIQILNNTVKRRENRYESGLLWRNEDVKMPENQATAMGRLKKLEKSLMRDPKKAEAYGAAIRAYVDAGHARKLPREEAEKPHEKLWLLPHHAVVNPNKPKLRVVFDAAASHLGVSLNSELMRGPDLLQNLVGILLRFRQEKVAIVADITQMFHQIQIREQDQPALSFLWRDLDSSREPDMYRMLVAIFGAKCSPAIANYVLQKTAEDGCSGTAESLIAKEAVSTSFYMDDFVKSEASVEAARIMKTEVTSLLAHGGFNLTKWVSSEKTVLSNVPDQERGALKEDERSPGNPYCTVLGCKWIPEDDTISVKISRLTVPATKRGVLKQAASVYDPLGMLTPFTLLAKKLIQDLWREQFDWDEPLIGDKLCSWIRWQEDLKYVEEVRIPRWYRAQGQESEAQYELHLFSDASEHAFGAIAYVRVLSHGSSYCQFVMARSRLAPLRQLSIVRLELQGAVLATRVATTIKKEIDYNFTRIFFWTDSRVVLQMLKNESRRYHTFVANRVSEIHESTSPEQWLHVPGTENPADLCSRGQSLSTLKEEDWWDGPSFLRHSEELWPPQSDAGELSADCKELKRPTVCALQAASRVQTQELPTDSSIPDPARFSSWLKFRRVVAWMQRFIKNARSKVSGTAGTSGPLQSEEIEAAEFCILRAEQRKPRFSSPQHFSHLTPFLDSRGLLRVGGRLGRAPLAEPTRHPVILQADSEITRLIITDAHKRVLHSGLERTLCEVRTKYWVEKMRSTVKKQLQKCAFCRNRRATPQPPRMADLPEARFDMRRPFSTVGLDYLGPLTVKKFRKTEKRYVLLLTCLATRAVHLEMTVSMDTECFLMALRRFIARRGKPQTIYSDNGTNIVGGERELRDQIERWNQAHITDTLSQSNIKWVFLPPAAPHMGGSWERLVATVKRALRVVLGNQCVSEDVLLTALAEVEFMVNGRPLTYVSSDPQDEEPLTPNHFLLGASDAREGLPPGVFNDRDLIGRRRWRQTQILADHLWTRWRREYLPFLADRKKWRQESRNLQEGDVVLMADTYNAPRGDWPLGRITRVFPGSDGRVRSAEVKTRSGTYTRPAHKLCLLEGADDDRRLVACVPARH